jgi:hypothetical protein
MPAGADYRELDEPIAPPAREAEGWVGAAGAIYSTAADLVRRDLGLMDRRILSSTSWSSCMRLQTLAQCDRASGGRPKYESLTSR